MPDDFPTRVYSYWFLPHRTEPCQNNSVFQENMVGVAATGLFHTELIVVLTCFDG